MPASRAARTAAPPSGLEVELKLLLPAAAARRVGAHRLLKGRSPPSRARLHAIYYDTPALDLWRRGIALRVRREGRRWVQTVKGGGGARGGLHARSESEATVRGPEPDLSRVKSAALARALRARGVRDGLKPLFTTDFARDTRVLQLDGGARVEASIDRGVVRAGDRSEPVNELELELRAGAPRQLYDLALALAADVPFRLGDQSKAERGYALARDEPRGPVRARPARLARGMAASEAFKAIMWANFAHLHANCPGVLEGRDPEYLHQARVALRRLRSAFGLFAALLPEPAARPLRDELRWLASELAPARDWDVFATETLPPVAAQFGPHPGLAALGARGGTLRRAASARARRAMRSARYRRLELSLAAWLTGEDWLGKAGASGWRQPARGYASEALEAGCRRVRARGRGIERLSARELHRLRIAIKRLRYAADFFATLYEADAARPLLKRLSRLQDILGSINDAATVARLLDAACAGAPGVRAVEARGIVHGWSLGRAAALKGELKAAWKDFRATRKFW